jgi:hypothetical protein
LKIIYVDIDKENRLMGWGSNPSPTSIKLEVEESHEVIKNPYIYRFENNALIRDDEYQAMKIKQQEKAKNQPTVAEKIQTIEMMQAEMAMDSVMKDLTIQEQAEQLQAADTLTANLLFDLSMKGVI